MGITYRNMRLFNKALGSFEKSLEILEKLKGKDSIEIVFILSNIASVYIIQGNYHDALQYYERIL